MGWYFRKSLNLGSGLRLNFSKSGVGLSAGAKGFRFGINPRGRRYIHCGGGGIYYRKTLSNASSPQASASRAPLPARTPATAPSRGGVGPQQSIESGDVMRMTSSSAAELLQEIRTKHGRPPLHRWFLALALTGFAVAVIQQSPKWAATAPFPHLIHSRFIAIFSR